MVDAGLTPGLAHQAESLVEERADRRWIPGLLCAEAGVESAMSAHEEKKTPVELMLTPRSLRGDAAAH